MLQKIKSMSSLGTRMELRGQAQPQQANYRSPNGQELNQVEQLQHHEQEQSMLAKEARSLTKLLNEHEERQRQRQRQSVSPLSQQSVGGARKKESSALSKLAERNAIQRYQDESLEVVRSREEAELADGGQGAGKAALDATRRLESSRLMKSQQHKSK